MKPLRVLMVVRLFYPWVGGTERQALKLAQALRNQGVAVEIVTGRWFRGTPQQETVGGIPVFRNHTLWEMFGIKGLRKFGGYLYMLTLFNYLRRRRGEYDIIHVHGLNYHTAVAALAGRWFGRKTVTKLANSGSASDITKMRTGRQLALSRYLLPTALDNDRFIALTPAIAQELVAVGVPQEQIVQLVNGVESERISPRPDYGLHQPPCLLYAGRLHPQKGADVLLGAVAQVVQLRPGGLCLRILGDGPLRDSLQVLARGLDLEAYVEFCGQVDDVLEQMQAADLFVLPSRAEGLSNALLEAMACGLPVVASDVPGNAAVVEHGRNGLLFPAGDATALAAALLALLNQPELRQCLGRAARQTVEQHYSLDYVAERYLALYQELLSGREEDE